MKLKSSDKFLRERYFKADGNELLSPVLSKKRFLIMSGMVKS